MSLLRDSYVDLSEIAINELVAYFLALTSGAAADEAVFRARFDLMALQRNLKALGTFGYQTLARGNTVYIQYIPRTLRYARDTLRRYAALRPATDLLARPRRGAAVVGDGSLHESTEAPVPSPWGSRPCYDLWFGGGA